MGPSVGFAGVNESSVQVSAGDSLKIENRDNWRMQGFRRAINAAIGDQLVLKHFIVDLDADKVCEQRSACQYVIEHLRTTVMQHGKATVGGQVTLDRGKHAPRQMS